MATSRLTLLIVDQKYYHILLQSHWEGNQKLYGSSLGIIGVKPDIESCDTALHLSIKPGEKLSYTHSYN